MHAELHQLPISAKILITLAANSIIAFSMGLMHYSMVGADPVTVLIGGLAIFLKLSEGTAASLLSSGFFLFTLLFNRTQIKGATFLSVLTLGPFFNASLSVIRAYIPATLPFAARVAMAVLGSCIMGLAIGFYLSLRFGASPTDSVMLWFHKVLQWDYRYCTWIFYGICLSFGVMMGGVFGIGSMLSLILVGKCCDFMIHRLQPCGSNL